MTSQTWFSKGSWLRAFLPLISILMLTLSGCGGSSTTSSGAGLNSGSNGKSATEIKIGGLTILNGPFAVDGEATLRGVQVAIAASACSIPRNTITSVTHTPIAPL